MYQFTVKNMNIILNNNFEYNFEINQLFIFTKNNFTDIIGNPSFLLQSSIFLRKYVFINEYALIYVLKLIESAQIVCKRIDLCNQ